MTAQASEFILVDKGRQLLNLHASWWQRQSCLVSRYAESKSLEKLWLPLADGSLAEDDIDLTPEMLDFERMVGKPQEPGNLEIYQQRFGTVAPFGQIPWLEAILEAPIRVTVKSGGMRSKAYVQNWEDWHKRQNHFDQNWFDLLMRLTAMLVERSNGRLVVTAPTLRGPSDLAEALLGPEMMSLAMYDNPQELNAFLEEVSSVFIRILQAILKKVKPVAGGYVSPFGIWAPGTVVRTQCDATAFLSATHYQHWYLPFDLCICEAFDYSIIHLHSCSLHTVDALLEQNRPHAIQVTLEDQPKGPSLESMLVVFEKILQKKPLLLEGKLTEDEISWLLDHLPNHGLAITARSSEW